MRFLEESKVALSFQSSDPNTVMKTNLKPTDKVTAKVQFEEYDRCGSDISGIKTVSYTGSYENVVNLISENHSYSWSVGEDEDGDVLSCDDVLNSVVESNGDGCDFIISLVIKSKSKNKKIVAIEEDVEEVYCD